MQFAVFFFFLGGGGGGGGGEEGVSRSLCTPHVMSRCLAPISYN